MKIGIDARQISHRKRHGLRTYVENLVKALSKIDKKNEYILYIDSNNPFTLDFLGKNFALKILPWNIPYISTLLNDHVFLPLKLKKDKIDIMHYPANPVNYRNPISQSKTVFTIHDVLPFFARRGSVIKRIISKGVLANLLSWFQAELIKYNSKKSVTVITISKKSKEDLIQYVGIPSNRIRMIYEGVNKSFQRKEDIKEIKEIKKRYNLGNKFIMGFAHKNGNRIIEGYSNLSEENKKAYRVGLIWLKGKFSREIQRIIEARKLNDKIICIPPVSEEDLVLLYSSASLFVFPSFYEGFGLPVLEAMRCGCPVICSDRGSLPEIAGKAAIFVHELDNIPVCVDEISKKMEMVLTQECLKKELIRKGLKQSLKFSWENTARKTLNVYEEVHAQNYGR
jgi:glycosyltransferase involved in cell wall biosynthesis